MYIQNESPHEVGEVVIITMSKKHLHRYMEHADTNEIGLDRHLDHYGQIGPKGPFSCCTTLGIYKLFKFFPLV